MYLVTGASGQLGRLVVASLRGRGVPAANIVAAVRSPEAVADLAGAGVAVRYADYAVPESLAAAFEGVERALLVSSSEIGQRAAQHQNVINAAIHARVKLLAYTSILHADTSPLALAEEHKTTEAALAQSGLECALLRNGWYLENYTANAPAAVAHGAVLGSAGDGRISAASRSDYAEAAAVVLTSPGQAGRVYELAGDHAFTMAEYAARLASHSDKTVAYQNMPEAQYAKALIDMGLPQPFAELLANSDVAIAQGGLLDDSRTLSQLIGRPTTTLDDALRAAL